MRQWLKGFLAGNLVAAMGLVCGLALAFLFVAPASAGDFYARGDIATPGDGVTIGGVGAGYDLGPVRVEATYGSANYAFHVDETVQLTQDVGVTALDYEYDRRFELDQAIEFDVPTSFDFYLASAYVDLPDVLQLTPFIGAGAGVVTTEAEVPYVGELRSYGALQRAAAGFSFEVQDHVDVEVSLSYWRGEVSQLGQDLDFEFPAVGVAVRGKF